MRPGESEERRPGGGDAHLLATVKAKRFRAQIVALLTQIGTPIPAGSHSDVIEHFHDGLSSLGLDPDVTEVLVDRRGEDCVPKWGSQICTNDPCPQDCATPGRCADYMHAFPHRLRAGASMRYGTQFAVGAP